jgi:hypothetical protein
MKSVSVKIFILIIFVGTLVPLFPVKPVQAQFVVEFGPAATTLVSSIITATSATATAATSTAAATGIVGTGYATVASLRESMGNTCKGIIIALQAGDVGESVLNVSSSAALDVIGGGTGAFTKSSVMLAKAISAKACVDTYVEGLSRIGGTLDFEAAKSPELDKFTKVSATLQQKIDNLNAQQNASVKDILKAFMVKVILNLNKNLTTELVNKMVEKYKISDYLAYGDALTTQVYSMKYINANYSGDARQQMMIRSLLQSDKLPDKVQTVQTIANTKAQEYIGQACDATNQSTGSDEMKYLKCLASWGSPQANSDFHISQVIDQANAAKASAQQSTAAELSQSNGYAPPRNCSGSLAQQQQIDSKVDAAAKALTLEQLALSQYKKQAGVIDPAEVAKGQAKIDQAKANYDALFKQLQNSGGKLNSDGKSTGGAIIDICEAITSPASFVATSLGDFLKQHIDQGSQLKSDNLPFYLNFLSDVTSNFLTNILTGNKSSSQVLKEAGVGALNGAIIGVAQTAGTSGGGGTPANPNDPAGSLNGVKVYATLGSDATPLTTLAIGKTYNLFIDLRSVQAKNPSQIVIRGLNGPTVFTAKDLPANGILNAGTIPITSTTKEFSVTVDFYFPELSGAYQTTTPQKFSVGTVKGDYTTVPYEMIMPRGPAVAYR